METNNIFRTKDLYLAAFIYSQNTELIKVERDNQTCWFIFTDKALCEELQNLYWAGKGTATPKALTDAIRSLKDLIFAG